VESAPGKGGLCGSTFLDRRFDRWLRDKFATSSSWAKDSGYHEDAMSRWISEIKVNFDGETTNVKFQIPARGFLDNPLLGVRHGKFEISGEEVKQLFDPVVHDILDMVKWQVAETEKRGRTVKMVLLAGGFGWNPYLQRKIKALVGDHIIVKRMDNW